MTNETMEEIRLLWNWEQDGDRLLQIVLIGQPELRPRLHHARWESLRQRIVLSYHLGRLSADQTARYVAHRLRVASNGDCAIEFSPGAVRQVHEATKGVPRLINTLCDNALLSAYARGEHTVSGEIVAGVVQNMTCWSMEPPASEHPAEPASAAHRPPDPARAPATGPPDRAAPHAAPAKPATPSEDQHAPEPLRQSSAVLQAALLGQPTLEVAREVYRLAPALSEAHHLAIRIIAQELVRVLGTRRQ